MMKMRFVAQIVGVLVMATPAAAQTDATQRAMASQLFDDAQKLFASGQVAEACSKYSESQRLDPQLGTLLYLGDCFDKLGKTASAWISFKDAAEMAKQRRDERGGPASMRVDELEAKLSTLTIEASQNLPANVELLQDGVSVGRAVLGSPVPIDPGRHEIRARAPGFKDWSTTVDVPNDRSEVRVVVQTLEPMPNAIAPTAAAPVASPLAPATQSTPLSSPTHETGSSRRTLGYVVGGVGLVGIGVGTAFALAIHSKVSDRDNANRCSATASCSSSDRTLIERLTSDARTDATVANVGFIAGSAALLGGLALVITGLPQESRATGKVEVQPWLTHSTGGIGVGGQW